MQIIAEMWSSPIGQIIATFWIKTGPHKTNKVLIRFAGLQSWSCQAAIFPIWTLIGSAKNHRDQNWRPTKRIRTLFVFWGASLGPERGYNLPNWTFMDP